MYGQPVHSQPIGVMTHLELWPFFVAPMQRQINRNARILFPSAYISFSLLDDLSPGPAHYEGQESSGTAGGATHDRK